MAKSEPKYEQLCAILSYLLIGIIWYFVDKPMQKNGFVKFHVKQAIILFIFGIIWSIGVNIIFGLIFFGIFLWPFIQLLSLVPLVFTIIGILNALNKNEKELPIIGKYAEKLDF